MGEKYNPSFRIKERVERKSTVDRMLAFVVDAPLEAVEARTELRLRLREVDGPISELMEQR